MAASIVGGSILLQLIALFRALDVRDNDEKHYAITVRWFLAGVVLLLGVGMSIVSSSAPA